MFKVKLKYLLVNENLKIQETLRGDSDCGVSDAINIANKKGLYVKRVITNQDLFLYDLMSGVIFLDQDFFERSETINMDNITTYIDLTKLSKFKVIKNISGFKFEIVFEITKDYKFMVKSLTNDISIGHYILKPGHVFSNMKYLLYDIYKSIGALLCL